MSHERFDLKGLDDQKLLDGLKALNRTAAETMADLLCHLAEVDRRKLYVDEACSSLFNYALEVLGCTEDEASRRIHAARAGGKFPVIFELVARGDVALTAVSRLAPHLTAANHVAVLAEAKGKTLREIDELVARLAPRPDVAPRLVRVPERPAPAPQVTQPLVSTESLPLTTSSVSTTAGTTSAPTAFTLTAPPPATVTADRPLVSQPAPVIARARVEPLSPERWALRVTIGAAAQQALRKAQDLSNPRQDEAAIVEQALLEYAERLEARKHAKLRRTKTPPAPPIPATTSKPERNEPRTELTAQHPDPDPAQAPTSAPATDTPLHVAKHVAAQSPTSDARVEAPPRCRRPTRAIMRQVRERDGDRCTFESSDGRRCSATARLEVHS